MTTIQTWNLSKEEMEDFMDHAKAAVMKSLVREGVLDLEEADEWSKTHTIILKKKNFFRTITNIWEQEQETDGTYVLVVQIPDLIEADDDDDGEREDLPEEDENENVVELKRRA